MVTKQEYYLKNRDKILKQKKEYRLKNNHKLIEYRLKNKDKITGRNQKQYRRIKSNLINFLGGKCRFCGETDQDILQLDHKFNDGFEYRKIRQASAWYGIYLKNLQKTKKKIQLLCANCNLKKRIIFDEFRRLERYGMVGF